MKEPNELTVFEKLVQIKDQINQQIPLAANRFPEFECPPDDEQEHDTDIQYHMHGPLDFILTVQYTAMEEINTAYHQFLNGYQLSTAEPIPEEVAPILERYLTNQIALIQANIKSSWGLTHPVETASMDDTQDMILKIIQSRLPGLCQYGDSNLTVDENEVIRIYFQGLKNKAKSLLHKLLHAERMTADELELFNLYRREGVRHEEEVNLLFEEVNKWIHIASASYPTNKTAMNQFYEDVLYNIEQLEKKVLAQEHSFAARYKYCQKMMRIRDSLSGSLLITELIKFPPSVGMDLEGDQTKKSITMLQKTDTLHRGLYYELHQYDSGFCGEHVALALVKCINQGLIHANRLEQVIIRYGDGDNHAFIVINRSRGSELNDMSTWGDQAILFDPWQQLVCYAKDINNQGRRYRSYPSGAEWQSLTYKPKDGLLLHRLKQMHDFFTATGNTTVEIRESRLIEEYALCPFDSDGPFMNYMADLLQRYQPKDFKHELKFYLTSHGNDLIKFIPGFKQPVIAIHIQLFQLLVEKVLSLTSFEFGLVNLILHIQMNTSFVSPLCISHETQHQLDTEAMEIVNSNEAAIEYLRADSLFKANRHDTLVTTEFYEKQLGGLPLKEVTRLNTMERIKLIQASLAAGIAKKLSKELDYPSFRFLESLQGLVSGFTGPAKLVTVKVTPPSERPLTQPLEPETSQPPKLETPQTPKLETSQTLKLETPQTPKLETPQTPKLETPQTPKLETPQTPELETSQTPELETSQTPELETPQTPELETSQTPESSEGTEAIKKTTPSQHRISILNQLIEQLPELKIELLPYEQSKAPSIRIRQFVEIIASIEIDYTNPEEAELVDQLIDKANELEIPAFEYLYYSLAGLWGVSNINGFKIVFTSNSKHELVANSYYLIKEKEHDDWDLYYFDCHNNKHILNTRDVIGLNDLLNQIKNPDRVEYVQKSKAEFYLYRFHALRPLGFFKTFQRAITEFTEAETYDQALIRAEALINLRNKWLNHFDDSLLVERIEALSRKQQTQNHVDPDPVPQRYYGSDLGKKIAWQGFNLSSAPSISHSSCWKFFPWAEEDKSGLIAEILYRLGFSNHNRVITSLTRDRLDEFSKKYYYQSFVFMGTLSGVHEVHFRYDDFSYLLQYYDECKANQHQLDNCFTRTTLSFEQAFIDFYEKNLPLLVRPDLKYNQNTKAQRILLEKFYQIAKEGTDEEKEVVKGFFYGREDNRDLSGLLSYRTESKSGLKLDSSYAKFIFFQIHDGEKHHLFDDYDLSQLIRSNNFIFYGVEYSLEQFGQIFRLPQMDAEDALFNALLDKCEQTDYSNLWPYIVSCYMTNYPCPLMFTPTMNRMVLYFSNRYLESEIRARLNQAIWPALEDNQLDDLNISTLVAYYSILDQYTLFPSRKTRDQLGMIIFNRIMKQPGLEDQIKALESWLFSRGSKLPISDIQLKNRIIDQLVDAYTKLYGKDNGTNEYYKSINPLISNLLEQLFSRDLKQFMSKLLLSLEAQKKLSERVGVYVDPGDYRLFNSSRYKAMKRSLIGLIKLADYFSKREENQKMLMDFLSSVMSQPNLDKMVDYVNEHLDARQLSAIMGWQLVNYDKERVYNKVQTDDKIGSLLMNVYHQFWDCSLAERAAIVEQLIIPASKTLSTALQSKAYEVGLKYVSEKLFPQANDPQSEDHLALSIMISYLRTADNFIRSYLLTAILVSANESSGQEVSTGKKLALICEHMGPAYVKLAQAIHSHPGTSDALRADLAHVKGKANPPFRWSLIRQIFATLSLEDSKRIVRIGKLLGSASYNLAVEIELNTGEIVVLLLLRENAEIVARKGFAHIKATIEDCKHQTIVKNREMMSQTIEEAARLSENEMKKEASDRQSALAKELYPGLMKFNLDKKTVKLNIKTSSIVSSKNGYRIIELIDGEEFNEFPDAPPNNRFIKRAVARAVLCMELHNIFRGGQFDSDRHGNQLRIQVVEYSEDKGLELNIGLYDFGEMALERPSRYSLGQLARVINRLPLDLYKGKTIDQSISACIDEAVTKGESTHFLMRLRKAFLAMHDFQAYLSQADLYDILNIVASHKDIHPLLSGPLYRLAWFSTSAQAINSLGKGIRYAISPVSMFTNHLRKEPITTEAHHSLANSKSNSMH